MKHHTLKIHLTVAAAMALFMAVSAFTGLAQTPAAAVPTDYCAVEFTSPETGKTIRPIYNPDLGTEQVMEYYHTTMNEQFNWYISRMLAEETSAARTGIRSPLGRPPEPVGADNPQVLKRCPEDGTNFSTYCVAERLLTDETFGYIAYRRALDCKRGQLFDSTQQKDLWDKWIETTTCLGGVESLLPPEECTRERASELEKQIGGVYQAQQALMMSARLEAIAREKTAAKRALDQTLAAYNELRTAWPMHKKYIEIYASLIKYRDKLIEIRNQVEEFPSKFIDATTTKCT